MLGELRAWFRNEVDDAVDAREMLRHRRQLDPPAEDDVLEMHTLGGVRPKVTFGEGLWLLTRRWAIPLLVIVAGVTLAVAGIGSEEQPWREIGLGIIGGLVTSAFLLPLGAVRQQRAERRTRAWLLSLGRRIVDDADDRMDSATATIADDIVTRVESVLDDVEPRT